MKPAMTRSGKAAAPVQLTIDDFDLGVEHIPGGMPPGQQDVDQARRELYEQITAGFGGPLCCLPDQHIHIFDGGDDDRCHCARTKGK